MQHQKGVGSRGTPRTAKGRDTGTQEPRSVAVVSTEPWCLSFRLLRELRSPNKFIGRHWRVKHRESQEWEQAIWATMVVALGARTLGEVLWAMNAVPESKRVCTHKRRVKITRLSPARRFIRDDDNLWASAKPVLDALKRQGYIKDDRRKWLELEMAPQQASEDGECWTLIDITEAE